MQNIEDKKTLDSKLLRRNRLFMISDYLMRSRINRVIEAAKRNIADSKLEREARAHSNSAVTSTSEDDNGGGGDDLCVITTANNENPADAEEKHAGHGDNNDGGGGEEEVTTEDEEEDDDYDPNDEEDDDETETDEEDENVVEEDEEEDENEEDEEEEGEQQQQHRVIDNKINKNVVVKGVSVNLLRNNRINVVLSPTPSSRSRTSRSIGERSCPFMSMCHWVITNPSGSIMILQSSLMILWFAKKAF